MLLFFIKIILFYFMKLKTKQKNIIKKRQTKCLAINIVYFFNFLIEV